VAQAARFEGGSPLAELVMAKRASRRCSEPIRWWPRSLISWAAWDTRSSRTIGQSREW
jgi:hypothetical protein